MLFLSRVRGGGFLEKTAAAAQRPGVCRKTRSGGTSKPQILRGELQGIGVCQNGIFSTRRGDRAQQRPPELTKFLHFCDISRLRQEVSLFAMPPGV